MRFFKFCCLTLLIMIAAQGTTSAERPEVSANEMGFDLFKGGYVLKGNVRVAMDNHGFRAKITADEAFVSLTKQRCWADGKVKLEQEGITLGCNRAYIEWATQTAKAKGSVKFTKKSSVAISSDTAVFNWYHKIVDFYGSITLKAEKNLKFAEGVKLDGKTYKHVRYSVAENKILALDKTYNAPEVRIPSIDED